MATSNLQALTPHIQDSGSVQLQVGAGAPDHTAAKGTLYINTSGSSTSTRLYVNTDGGTTWTSFTSAA